MARSPWGTLLIAIVVGTGCTREQRPNVVLVVIDTLRRDRVSGLGHTRETTPRLDALMAEGVVFERAISASSQTVPATASLLAGLYPSETSVQYYGEKSSFDGVHPWSEVGPYVDSSLSLLPEKLRADGYDTAAVVANPWVRDEFGFGQGFDRFIALDCGDLCDGKDVVDEALSFLEDRTSSSPFFIYLHFMDVHNPYRKPGITQGIYVEEKGTDRYRNGLTPNVSSRDLDYMRDLYDEGVHYVDAQIGRLLDRLEPYSATENTLLIVTSDHGDEFDEHGGLGHGTTLHEELVGSFIVLRYPKKLPAKRVTTLVSLVDVVPTIIELIDGSDPDSASERSLLRLLDNNIANPIEDRFFVAELGPIKAIRRGEWKLILDIESGEPELYHIATDPGETENLVTMNPRRPES